MCVCAYYCFPLEHFLFSFDASQWLPRQQFNPRARKGYNYYSLASFIVLLLFFFSYCVRDFPPLLFNPPLDALIPGPTEACLLLLFSTRPANWKGPENKTTAFFSFPFFILFKEYNFDLYLYTRLSTPSLFFFFFFYILFWCFSQVSLSLFPQIVYYTLYGISTDRRLPAWLLGCVPKKYLALPVTQQQHSSQQNDIYKINKRKARSCCCFRCYSE